jgi:hypothetical protein
VRKGFVARLRRLGQATEQAGCGGIGGIALLGKLAKAGPARDVEPAKGNRPSGRALPRIA